VSSFDFSDVYSGLKDFQCNTVDYVFNRLYLDDPPARRFLVADEVGLGKTLVARGVIARAAEHLDRKGVKRIDVVYICSNTEIARQNIRRLSLPGFERSAFSSRLTMLPLETKDLANSRLNFIAFTPSTALDLKGNMGWSQERALLYWLLKEKWPGLVGNKKGPLRVFQGQVSSLERFEGTVRWMKPRIRGIDADLRNDFFRDIDRHDEEARRRGEAGIKERFEELSQVWARKWAGRSWKERHERNLFVGELRSLLARACIGALEPDLVILDEFQRFRHLLDDGSEASELAHSLFDYSDEDEMARVLLLSATPYKMYTLREESEEDDHYSDFLRTTRFLMDGESEQFASDLAEYGKALTHLDPGHLEPLVASKERVERALRRVMCRTERLAFGEDRNGMLTEISNRFPSVRAEDFVSFVALDRAARELEAQNPTEFWKSAPYFPNFWDGYQIGRRFGEVRSDKAAEVASLLDKAGCLLPWEDWRRYHEIDPGNGRLRVVASDLVDQGAWKLLWLPPALPYYQLAGPFAGQGVAGLTKRLLFSSWNAVPRAVSTILSYEVERRMMTAYKRPTLENSVTGRERFTEPIRFPTAETSGMSAFAWIYPSRALTELGDPLVIAAQTGETTTVPNLVAATAERISSALDEVIVDLDIPDGGPLDERWYWIAPLMLDTRFEGHDSWLTRRDIAKAWTGSDDRSGGVGFQRHLDAAVNSLDEFRKGELELGAPPDDLAQVLAMLAIGGPGNVAYRAFRRLISFSEAPQDLDSQVRNAAARVAWGLRSLFNSVEVTQLVRGLYPKGPYWQKALRYSIDGCLQSVLDEYVFVLREFEGIVGDLEEDDLAHLAQSIADVVSLRSSDLRAQDPLNRGETQSMRVRFALPFGQRQSEDEEHLRRSGFVRTAFNSPFWPFVLTTTSIGQEGLDFHLYCHAVVHWNLPSNPVDLEQREGRVHRYMGHAVRKNLAAMHGDAVDGASPWATMLAAAEKTRGPGENDLVPYWVYPGPHRIERHVPRLPLSREDTRLPDLRRSLVLYRLVFGQARQQEMVELLKRLDLTDDDISHLVSELLVDLAPPNLSQSEDCG
jgi:hypothetical protein